MDALRITGGQLDVRAVGHGIRGRDSVEITGGSFVIAAERDGIQSNNDQDPALGTVTVRSGSFDIAAGQDAIQAETALHITGGDFRLKSGKGCQDMVVAPGALVWGGADAALSFSSNFLTSAIISSREKPRSSSEISNPGRFCFFTSHHPLSEYFV